jgi:hypothetical protein
MRKKWAHAVVAAAIIGSTSASAMQFDLRPEQVKQMAVTATQTKAIAEFKTVAVLVSVPNQLVWNTVLNVFGLGQWRDDKCANIQAINDWNFSEEIENHLSGALSSRFTVVSVSYDAEAVGKPTIMGQIPRSALPVDDRVDAFIVVWGSVQFWHGMPGDIKVPGDHSPEYQFVQLTVDIINARTQRTIVRKEIQPSPTFGREFYMDENWHVRGKGAKERPEADWLCGRPLTEELKQEVKDDYRMIIQAAFDFALPLLRLAPPTQSQSR